MKQKHRLERVVASAIERVGYGECERHVAYATKAGARRAMRAHVALYLADPRHCGKCRGGRRPNVFACCGWREHWHWGHADTRNAPDGV